MKKKIILLSIIVALLLSAACSLEQPVELKEAPSVEAAVGSRASNPKMDVEVVLGIGGKMYVDLAVSNTMMYRLHENGNVMREDIAPGWSNTPTLYRNYDHIDYVTDGGTRWGLIGASDETRRIYIRGEVSTSSYGYYPSGVNYVHGIAGRQLDSNRLIIYIKVSNQYFGSHLRMGLYDKRISNRADRIQWYSDEQPYGAYSNGLSINGSYIMKWLCYYENKLQRWTSPASSYQSEKLGSYDSHGYNHGGVQYLNPLGFDYCPADGYYYCLDNTSTSQAVVRIRASNIQW
jgi:hypothetical protein